MNFIKAEQPKRNENDLKIIAEIDVLQEKINRLSNNKPTQFSKESYEYNKNEIDNLKKQLSLGYWCEVFGLVNLPINLDHVVTFEKDSFLKENKLIPQIRFETVIGVKFLTFASKQERDTLHRHIEIFMT